MARCKGCGAEIDWITTRAGKHMPVDPAPVFVAVGDGKDVFVTDDGEVIHGRALSSDDGSAEVAFVSHFATCPVAGSIRRWGK
ncbi:MAG: hypothetical protein IJA11_08645 [Oscillospiraceae bacterium]|nr:hypothetical protein [Oscillospiraceae bacterium]